MTDVDYANDLALLANTPTRVESLMHSLEQAASDFGFYENAGKTEVMFF